MFSNECNEDKQMDAVTFPFNCLPNELKTHVIQHMTLKERETIGSIGNMNELVKIAGCKPFSNVHFNSTTEPVISAWDEITPQKKIKDSELGQYFKQATTCELRIEGIMDDETDVRIKYAFKSLFFKELDITFSNDYSGRIVSDLLRGRSSIDEVRIHWEGLNDDVSKAKEVLMSLPSMQKCEITGNTIRPLIDDDVLLHIVNHTSVSVDLDIRNTHVSAVGLARAFEVLQKCETDLRVRCFVSNGVLSQYLSSLGADYAKLKGISTVMHRSGASLWAVSSFFSVAHDIQSDECAIVMRSNFR